MGDTFINLTNQVLRVNNEVEIPTAQFTTVTGIPAFAKDCVNFSINDILQSEQQWPFNHNETTQILVADQQFYTLPTDFSDVDWESFFLERDDTLEISAAPLRQIDRDEWHKRLRASDDNGVADGEGKRVPNFVIRMQDETFGLSPVPSDIFSVTFEFWVQPSQLSVATDTTTIPDRYSWVITQGAAYYRYMQRDNEVLADRAFRKFQEGIQQMRTQLINSETYAYANRTNARRGFNNGTRYVDAG